MVSSSQQESSRNAVEERPGRGNALHGQSSLHDEKSIKQKISHEGFSRETLEMPSGRVKSKHRVSLTGNLPMCGLFTVRVKPSVYRAHSMMFLFMTIFRVGFCAFMPEDHAKSVLNDLKDKQLSECCGVSLSTAGSTNDFRSAVGYYKCVDDGKTDARSSIGVGSSGMMRWNYTRWALTLKEGAKIQGFSCSRRTNTLKVYLRESGSQTYPIFTAAQNGSSWIIIPFLKNEVCNLSVFSTYTKEVWTYVPTYEKPNKVFGLKMLALDMKKGLRCDTSRRRPSRYDALPDQEDYLAAQLAATRAVDENRHRWWTPEGQPRASCNTSTGHRYKSPPRQHQKNNSRFERFGSNVDLRCWVHKNCSSGTFIHNDLANTSGITRITKENQLQQEDISGTDHLSRASIVAMGKLCACGESMPNKHIEIVGNFKMGALWYNCKVVEQ